MMKVMQENPHVRFCERKFVSAKPRYGVQLYNKLRVIVSAVVLAAFATGFAAEPKPSSRPPRIARMRFDHATNLYRAGETAKVEFSASERIDGPALREGILNVWADDGWTNVIMRRTIDLSKAATTTVELTRATPGSIRVYVEGNGIRSSMDRLLFDPVKIRPLTPCPDDFETYWRGERERLDREVPIAVEKIPAPEIATANHDMFRVSFATFGGKRIYGILAIPKGKGRFPAIINVPGAGSGERSLSGRIIRKGWITLMMNIHCIPLTGTKEEYKARYDAWFDAYAKKVGEPRYQYVGYAESREAPLYHRTILGMTRAIDWLAKEPCADPSRFVYYGASQGGGYGLYLTAMWGRFAKSLILCPNKCDMLAYREGRQPGSSHIWNQKPENRAKAERTAPYHDNCNFARLITTPVRAMVGTADDNCQTVGIIAAFNMIPSKDKAIAILPHTGHGWHTAGFDKWLFDL
ncbi:MAG: acetylxylan esterase [Kiritimatiellae bacterium]|nr:acetylxylan esterase [Kiritimatiellia bacterium]